jgi:IclR family transcriptional regulator, acetate operon repressor
MAFSHLRKLNSRFMGISVAASERVLDALIAITDAAHPLTAAALAATLNIPLSSAYRHIALLKRYDLVVDFGREAGFGPGPGCLRIGRSFDGALSFAAIANPEMQGLASRTEETVALMRAVGAEILCIEMIESPLSLRCSFAKGRSQPLSRGASAKALLAFMGEPQRAAILERTRKVDELQRAVLADELVMIRERGFAESESEVDAGVWGVSVPVFSSNNRLEGSLSVMAPTVRVGERRRRHIDDTISAAANISKLLSTNGRGNKMESKR